MRSETIIQMMPINTPLKMEFKNSDGIAFTEQVYGLALVKIEESNNFRTDTYQEIRPISMVDGMLDIDIADNFVGFVEEKKLGL